MRVKDGRNLKIGDIGTDNNETTVKIIAIANMSNRKEVENISVFDYSGWVSDMLNSEEEYEEIMEECSHLVAVIEKDDESGSPIVYVYGGTGVTVEEK